jgi:hypothetical protein
MTMYEAPARAPVDCEKDSK